jgi:hypothetical protein
MLTITDDVREDRMHVDLHMWLHPRPWVASMSESKRKPRGCTWMHLFLGSRNGRLGEGARGRGHGERY